MKRQSLSVLLVISILLGSTSVSAMVSDTAETISISEGANLESEHPPLSEVTKKAIADYKKKPCDETKQAINDALNEAYDLVIQTKKKNLEKHSQARTDRINAWMRTVIAAGIPPFMSLVTDNNKGNEREAIAYAVDTYRESPSSENKSLVQQALEDYYDAFLAEQQAHIIETEELRNTRIATSLEYFTSDCFKLQASFQNKIAQEDVLAEIICNYISIGAELIPVNPEARVKEREFNSAIYEAQMAYLDNPTDENETSLRNILTEVFKTAYDVRLEGYDTGEAKGDSGAETLFNKVLDSEFLDAQYDELTEQLNLYGRIDRMITFGCNTYGEWNPRMDEESQELTRLLSVYESSATEENKQAVREKFYDIYNSMLMLQKTHLEETQSKLESFVDETLQELIS